MEGIKLNFEEQKSLINAIRMMSVVVNHPEVKQDKELWHKIIKNLSDYLSLIERYGNK